MTAVTAQLDRLGPIRFAIAFALLLASLVYLTFGLHAAWQVEAPTLARNGFPLGNDFVAFWTAAALALSGKATAAFDFAGFHAQQIAIVGAHVHPTAWFYPPTFLLVVLPFGLLPYTTALVAWLSLQTAALGVLLHRLLPSGPFTWLLLAFPAIAVCLIAGQNGLLTAGLIAAGCLALDRRPGLAGLFFGLLSYKPHLAILLVPALMAAGYWRTLASAGATALGFAAASAVVLGAAPWQAFIANIGFTTELFESGRLPWSRMPTVFVTLRLLGIGSGVAWSAQVVASLATVAAVYAIWRRPLTPVQRAACLAVAIPFATPFAYDYDLVSLAFAIGCLCRHAFVRGPKTLELALLTVAWLAPALFSELVDAGGPPLMPVLLILLFAAIWRDVHNPA